MASQTHNSDAMECPYCGHKHEPEWINNDEEESDETCEKCGKKYHASQSMTISYQARPDCTLNGEEHNFELFMGAFFCVKCKECRLKEQME